MDPLFTTHSNVSTLQITTTVLIIIVSVLYYYLRTKKNNLPPGPLGVPLFGYQPFLGDRPEITLAKLKEKYGNIFSMYVGNRLAVVLGDFKAIQTAFHKCDDFNDRPDTTTTKILPEDKGIASASGSVWQIHRRTLIRAFRDIGVDSSAFEHKAQEEILRLLDCLDKFDGNGLRLQELLHLSLCNTISMILLGTKFDYTNESFRKAAHNILMFPKYIATTTMRLSMPWTKFIPFLDTGKNQTLILDVRKVIQNFFTPIIKQHEDTHDGDNRSDYVYAYITERKNQSPENAKLFDESTLFDTMLELFSAGTNTTEPTLRWLLLMLMIYPNIQKKLQAEIDDVVGMNRLPSLADRPRMPYTNAIIHEILRYTSLVPLSLLHCNDEKTTLFGYDIPAKTMIYPNLWAVHNDPKLWKDPENFRPERFINKEGQFEKSPYVVAFSIGKRNCLGENLAKIQIFLNLTSIFQRFTAELVDNSKSPSDYAETFGLINVSKIYDIRLKQRENYSVS